MPAGFRFTLNIAGLVVWHAHGDGRTGSFIAVRTSSGHAHGGHEHDTLEAATDHKHVAALTYLPSSLSGVGNRAAKAPDPLIASPGGSLFARRILEDEILWIDPIWADDPTQHDLDATVPNLISLEALDPRVSGIDKRTLSTDLAGTPAISRLDVAAGVLTEKRSLKGRWQARTSDESVDDGPRFEEVATVLALTFEPVKSLTIHSDKLPALRFAEDDGSETVASFTVEPATDFIPVPDEPFPHFEATFDLARWRSERPRLLKKLRATKEAAPSLTIKDRACPPAQS